MVMPSEATTTAPSAPGAAATFEDWLALVRRDEPYEFVEGRLIRKNTPDPRHGTAQGALFSALFDSFHRRVGDRDRPGGWWLSIEVDMDLKGSGVRPDLCGWRRDRFSKCPVPDARGVVVDVLDWVCEVLSPSTSRADLNAKREIYLHAGVGHYWLLNQERKMLTVLRRSEEGYLYVLSAWEGEIVKAEPFAAIDLELTRVFED